MLKILFFVLKFYISLIGITLILLLFNLLSSFYGDRHSQMPNKIEYDYIIVGAGTAGTTIFDGMDDTNFDILLVDAGQMPFTIMNIPILSPLIHQTNFNWNYQTLSQKFSCKSLKDSKSKWSSGKGYGGSNIFNNMISHWGHIEDYRGWFNDTKHYDYPNDILPFFKHNDETFINLESFTKIGETLLKMGNFNDVKFTSPKLYQKDGWRWTISHKAYEKYLKKQKSNFEIITEALVTNILFSHNYTRASGVRLMKFDKIINIKARKGIILSAGTIGTPKILMQSGIGICDEISPLGIDCKHNLPVGRNLQDHITTGLDLITLNVSLHMEPINFLNPIVLGKYLLYGNGVLSFGGCEILGTFKKYHEKSRPDLSFMIMPIGITADSGVSLRHIINLRDKSWNEYFKHIIIEDLQTISILPVLLHPKSRGTIQIKSKNPLESPIINPNYLHNVEDVRLLIKGLKFIDELLKQTQLQQYNAEIYNRTYPGCEKFIFKSDLYWECYVRHLTLTVYHPVGTCRMGDPLDVHTVVDRNYRVKGLDNLYIVDASIMPELPSGNPNAIVIMLAKRFLSIMKENFKKAIFDDNHRKDEL